jgi:hypothetical protein
MVDLPSFQAAVLFHVFDKAPVSEAADTLDYRLSGEFDGTFYAAYVALDKKTGYEDSSLVLTLATHSDIVFLAATRAHQVEVARILSNLEDYDREIGGTLSVGEVVRIPDPYFSSIGLYAVVLLRPAVLSGFEGFGDCYTMRNRHLRFALTLFLTEEEWSYRQVHGHDALMDRFTDEQKSVLVFERAQ